MKIKPSPKFMPCYPFLYIPQGFAFVHLSDRNTYSSDFHLFSFFFFFFCLQELGLNITFSDWPNLAIGPTQPVSVSSLFLSHHHHVQIWMFLGLLVQCLFPKSDHKACVCPLPNSNTHSREHTGQGSRTHSRCSGNICMIHEWKKKQMMYIESNFQFRVNLVLGEKKRLKNLTCKGHWNEKYLGPSLDI